MTTAAITMPEIVAISMDAIEDSSSSIESSVDASAMPNSTGIESRFTKNNA